MPRPEPEILERSGSASSPKGSYISTGITDAHGREYVKVDAGGSGNLPPDGPVDGNGGPMRFTLPDLRWNVALLNGAAVIFTTAIVAMFLWLVDRIDDEFERLQAPVMEVQKGMAGQDRAISGIERSLTRIEDRLDTKPPPNAQPEKKADK